MNIESPGLPGPRRIPKMSSRNIIVALFLLLLVLPSGGFAVGNYTVEKKVVDGHTTYHLVDAKRRMDVGIVPDIGNLVYEFKVNGKDVLVPAESLSEYLAARALGRGIPFLAPFANRIDGESYYFQGKKYLLNDSLGNFLRDPKSHYPIHGLLAFDRRWGVVASGGSDAAGAFITSRLEFYKYPDLMAQFPFAHVWQITYRLKDGKLECATEVTNEGGSPMPVHFGYHPYFLPDGPREGWTLAVPADAHLLVTDALIPTGETESTDKYAPGLTEGLLLGETYIDGGFTEIRQDAEGLGHFWAKGKTVKIEVVFGRGYDYAIAFAPLNRAMVCIEPQTGPTNAFNLQHEGKSKDLIVLQPGKQFKATYWIVPTGY
jgi:aldose 1-epimerase